MSLPPISDPISTPGRAPTLFERATAPLLNDPRDAPFVALSLKILGTTVPAAVFLYWPGMFRTWLGFAVFAANSLLLLGPYILMLHNTSHRPLFKRQYGALNLFIPWVLGPFFGESPESYFAHHLGMHHAEGNLADDLSSTLPYRRDSLVDFLRYFTRFFFVGFGELSRYLWARKRYRLLRRLWVGELSFYVAVAALAAWRPGPTLWVFIIPFCFARFMMMAGNWAQHAFIDLADPGNPFLNSITCVNSSYNAKCFNDGYHIGHHLRPSMHWTEMPLELQQNLERYRSAGAIVFRKLDYFVIWLLLMTKQYGILARFYVDLEDGPGRSRAEIEALLRSRTRPGPAAELDAAADGFKPGSGIASA